MKCARRGHRRRTLEKAHSHCPRTSYPPIQLVCVLFVSPEAAAIGNE